MITAINESNYNSYNALFEKATELLSKQSKYSEGVAINSLEDYFCLIEDLVEYGGKQYTMLPLDEECFEIKANERLINVPDAFKKNGIAVKGDEVAEIIYFKIDRYFDFVDLNNTDIYIQWQSLASNLQNPPEGISREWVRDIDSEPGKLIFGWPLDSSITSIAGPIKFSVRFIMWETDEDDKVVSPKNIVYSFSTLDAQATINPALDCPEDQLANAADMISDTISKRIKNSKSSNNTIIAPKEPRFLLGLPTDEIDLQVVTNPDDNKIHYQYTFKVQADTNGDTGSLSYLWEREYDNTRTTLTTAYSDYILSEDEYAQPDSVYYVLQGNKYIAEELPKDTPLKTAMGPNGETINNTYYERYNVYVIDAIDNGNDVVGNYYVTATTTKGVAPNHKSTSKLSGPATIPEPKEAEVNFIFADGEKPIIRYNQQDNKYILNLSATGQVSKDKDVIISSTWKKGEVELETQTYSTKPVEIETSYTIESAEIDRNLQGIYTVEVVTQRNGVVKTKNQEVLVTYPAQKPLVSYTSEVVNQTQQVDRGENLEVKIEYENDYQNNQNEPTYLWYIAATRGAEYEPIEDKYGNQVTANTIDTKDYVGYLKCKVTNTYNGDSTFEFSQPVGIVG